LRATVKSAVKYAKTNGHMKLRMISGDHIETARVTALKAGILEEADDQDRQEYAVMHADTFEQKVGLNEDDKIADMQMFRTIMNDLRVLARAKPIHKFMIVEGLKQMGRNVVVTGDGINDVKAILAADVGLAMGSGCSAVKETSDVILTNDDFEATIKSIMWGRNIYNNVARFLQF